MLFLGHPRLQVDVGQGVELVHHDVEVVGAHASAKYGDAFAIEVSCPSDKFSVLAFDLNLVEV